MYQDKHHYFDMVFVHKMNFLIDKMLPDKMLDMNNLINLDLYHNIFHHLNMEMIDMLEHVLHMLYLENQMDIDKHKN
jgi:hypothetical protein